MKRALRWLSISIVFWTAVATIFALPQLGHSHDLHRVMLAALAKWWAWGVLVPAVLSVDRKLPFSPQQVLRRFLTHLAFGPFVCLVYSYVEAVLRSLFGIAPWSRLLGATLLEETFQEIFWSMLVYCLIVGVWAAYLYHDRFVSSELQMERLERNFSEARLNALRMQLDPHFIFNALNTVSSQVERDPKLARKMIEHLGDLLRLSLASQTRQQVTLSEELAFLDHYVSIQKIRFGESLKVQMSISPEVMDALVPSLFLQPLVENAIRHGISRRARGGVLMLNAHGSDQTLTISVLDDGAGLPANWSFHTHKGVGLSVTSERLAGIYPNNASTMVVRPRAEGGTEVVISMPLQKVGRKQ